MLITLRSCFRGSYGPDFTFYLDYFPFSSSLRTFIVLKCYFRVHVIANGPLAQSVERGANNGKVACSRLVQTRFHFLFGLLSLFK